MSRVFYIGVDPGSLGGLAAIDNRGVLYALTRMPSSSPEVYGWFEMFEGLETYAVLEQVSGFIGVEHPGSRMFAFGKGYGGLEMAMVAVGLREGVTYFPTLPQRWQKWIGLRSKEKGESDTSWKNYLKDEAQTLFPKTKVTLKTADALLLAHYCKGIRNGSS